VALIRLSAASLWNRRATAALTVLGIALSVAMLLGVEKVRRDARDAFANTLSGTDLVVGARSGSVQLLLYSVFRIGNATNNISWQSYQELKQHPNVAWSVPIALGDSHRGFRVMGTTQAYFRHYRYARSENLRFARGEPFDDVFDAVLGAEVAAKLGYVLNDSIVVTHGGGSIGITKHDDKPFRVVGVLERTGTPVDRTVHVSLEGIEAMHVDWASGVRIPGQSVSAEQARALDLAPKAITAALMGLDSRIAVFRVQRFINEYRQEPLLAILPGLALQELWDLMGVAENALRVVSAMVVASGLLGMLTVILTSLEARRREMAVLRSVGARPVHLFGLFMSEAVLLATVGSAVGIAALYVGIAVARPIAAREFGLHLPLSAPGSDELGLVALIIFAAFIAGAIPAFRAYRLSLADGLSMRV
jgi:putative ABC transport system permease protein